MNILRVLSLVCAISIGLGQMPVGADEAGKNEIGTAEGRLLSLDANGHIMRIDGGVYLISPSVEAVDIQEGGTIGVQSIRAGSQIVIRFHHQAGQKYPIVDYIEVHEMPLK